MPPKYVMAAPSPKRIVSAKLPVAVAMFIVALFFYVREKTNRRLYRALLSFLGVFAVWSFSGIQAKFLVIRDVPLCWYMMSLAAYLLPITANYIIYEVIEQRFRAGVRWIMRGYGLLMFTAIVGEMLGWHALKNLMPFYFLFIAIYEPVAFYWTFRSAQSGSPYCKALLAPNVVHCIRAAQTAHYYNFLFPADQLRFLPGSPANDDLAPVLDGTSLPLFRLTAAESWQREALARLQALTRFTKERPPAFSATILVHFFELVLLLRTHAPFAATAERDDADTVRTRHILQYIAAHYAEDVTLYALAVSAHCSKSACLRAFRATLQTTPYNYLIEYRLEQAALLLRQTNAPVAAIAEAVGFHHVSLFGKSFKAKTGATPHAYRNAKQPRA